MLGVSIDTLYVYVSRKGIRSVPTPNSPRRRYWRADVERARRGSGRRRPIVGEVSGESALTLYTDRDLFYRGRSVRGLCEAASFEAAAALLWGVPEKHAFGGDLPLVPPLFLRVQTAMAQVSPVDQALALFPLLEGTNPRAFDLTPAGMARSGADVLRWFCALTLQRASPSTQPIHEQFAESLRLSAPRRELVRKLLVLSADHGLEAATFAVRAMASTGVTPWRYVSAGLSVMYGRGSRLDQHGALARLIDDLVASHDPVGVVVRRAQDGEPIAGFVTPEEATADARIGILSEALESAYVGQPAFERYKTAIAAAADIDGRRPAFVFLSAFAWRSVGLKTGRSAFFLARAAGWIAHASEQYQAGERARDELDYRGPLPP